MGATRMFRLLAAMLLLAGLMLGQSGNGSFAYTGLAANGSALTAMPGESGGSGQSEGHRGGPSHGCHHSYCSQPFLVTSHLVPIPATPRFGPRPPVKARNERTI